VRPVFGIKTKLIIGVSFLTIALVIVIAYVAFQHLETNSKKMIANGQFAVVSLLANEIDDRLISAHEQLVILSKRLPPGDLNSPAKSLDFLNNHEDIRAVFNNGLFLFDSKCAIVAEVPQSPVRVGMDFSFREYLKTTIATRKPYISDPYVSSLPHHHPAVMLTAPVFNPRGELIGVLGGSIDLMRDNILGRLADMQNGKTGFFNLITKDRNLILHPDRSRILKNDIPVGANRALERAIAGSDGTEATVTSKGLHAIASFKHLKVKEWFVGAVLPIEEAYEPIYQAQKTLLLIVVVMIIVVPVVVWYLMNLLTRPVVAFTRHVESISGKKGEERLFPIASHDELGRLTKAFNEMVINLDNQQNELESQKERLAVTLRSIADGVIVTDTQGNLVLMNAAAERLTGWRQDEAAGLPLQDIYIIVDEKSRQPLSGPVTEIVARGTIESMRLSPVLISRDGHEHFISGSCAPIRDRESRIIGTILVFQDSTDKRRLEEEGARAEKLESIGDRKSVV
jgi:two-component system NtrC family sensor kinase